MTDSNNTLVLYTQSFPGNGEPYLENEVNVLAGKFKRILIIPADPLKQQAYNLPGNTEVISLPAQQLSNKSLFARNLKWVLTVFLKELFYSKKRRVVISHFREFNSYFLNALSTSKAIEKLVNQRDLSGYIHYSFWMNHWALSLALLKSRGKIKRFVFRTNGFDLYDNQTKYNYIPFRPFIFSQADKMFAVSKKGADYMRLIGVNTRSITHNYFGTADHGASVFDPGAKFTLFTCSDLRRIKRVHRMVDILKHIPFPVKWIHHGDKGDSQDIFYSTIKDLSPNVEFELHPHVKNYGDVLRFIKNHHFNLFILLSETEGIPVSIIEVTSFGIPVLATDVGGVSEVVNQKNGILIDKDFDDKVVAEKIIEFSKSEMNTADFRSGIRKMWMEQFSAVSNYTKFYNELINI